jgi:hypothetical protein
MESCFADVAAPEGKAEEDTTTAPVFTAVIFPSMDANDALPIT